MTTQTTQTTEYELSEIICDALCDVQDNDIDGIKTIETIESNNGHTNVVKLLDGSTFEVIVIKKH